MGIKVRQTDSQKQSRIRQRANTIFEVESLIRIEEIKAKALITELKRVSPDKENPTRMGQAIIEALTELKDDVTEAKLSLRDTVYIQRTERKSFRQSHSARRNNPARVKAYEARRAQRQALTEAYKAEQAAKAAQAAASAAAAVAVG